MKVQCLDIAQDISPSTELRDTIVLDNHETKLFYLLDMETGIQKHLMNDDIGGTYFVVSPDRHWLAYLQTTRSGQNKEPRLAVVSSDGQEVVSIPYAPEWGGISRWLDNQRLIFPDDKGKIPAEHFVLNPFTGEKQELLPLPSNVNSLAFRSSEAMMISYDPTLSYMVYPDEDYQTLLVNLHTREILASVDTPWETVPRWAPDGQSYILYTYIFSGTEITDYGLYKINLQGQMQRLTQFTHTGIERTSYTWSPDGHHVAMWLVTAGSPKNHTTLAILDMTTLDVVNTCITNERISKFPPELIWSPDSKQLVFEYSEVNHMDKSNVVVVDIQKGWAAQIAENMTPLGWMAGP
jgi:WD40 repeat protein